MDDLLAFEFRCSQADELNSVYNKIIYELPPDAQRRLRAIFSAYIRKYGFYGRFERINNRSIKQIFEEFDESDIPVPIASGGENGMTWALYDAPSSAPQQNLPTSEGDSAVEK